MTRYIICVLMCVFMLCETTLGNENNVTSQLKAENCLYIKINEFEKNTFLQVYDILKINNAENIVFDLRDNKGGVLNQAIKLAELFVNQDKECITVCYNNGIKNSFYGTGEYVNKKIVILVNSGTASAAEALSLCLKENGAYLIGEITYGKNSIQRIEMDNAEIVKNTVGKYLVNNIDIENIGIKPDLAVFNENKLVFNNKKNKYDLVERDIQLEQALKYINNKK